MTDGPATQRDDDQEVTVRFAPMAAEDAEAGAVNLADDSRIALLAVCLRSQQAAGFGDYIDLRQPHCATCGAPGFNTGWGYWRHTCGAEILSDGETSAPCECGDQESEGTE